MPTSIRLPTETEQRIAAIASKVGRTKASLIREMTERSIDDVEDYYLAAETSERVRKGEEETFTTDEIRRDLGLKG